MLVRAGSGVQVRIWCAMGSQGDIIKKCFLVSLFKDVLEECVCADHYSLAQTVVPGAKYIALSSLIHLDKTEGVFPVETS